MSATGLKITKGKDGTYRLTSMDIGEVSLVDRAANKRRFIFAKREDTMSGAELKETQDGSLVLEKDQGTDTDTDPTGTDDTGDVAKGIDLSAAKKAELAPLSHKVVEAALHFHNQVASAKEVKEGAAVPQSLVDEGKALKAAQGELDRALFGTAEGEEATASDTAGDADVEDGGAGSAPPAQPDKAKATKALTTEERNKLPDADFALPKERKYPIPDISHARNALARVAQSGTEAEQAQVRAAVERKYPELKKADGDTDATAEGDTPDTDATPDTDVDKATSTHQALLDEKVAALEKILGEIVGKVSTMDPEELRARMSQARDIMWHMEEAVDVVSVGKCVDALTDADLEAMASGELPDTLAKVGRKMSGRNLSNFNGALGTIRGELEKLFQLYRALLPPEQQGKADALHKRLIEDMGLPEVPADNAGGSFTWPESPAGTLPDAAEPGPAKDELARLEKLAKVKEAEAKELRGKLAKAEAEAATVPPPSSGQADGPQAGTVTKGDSGGDDDWPMDMNMSEYRRKVASGETT